MFKVAVIIGSLRKESFNRNLMLALEKLNPPNLQFNILKLDEVPVFNQDKEDPLPAAVDAFKNEIYSADAVLFVTPEYNRSMPGMLKNIVDWGTRPYGKNCWANKPTAIIGTSQSNVGTAISQSHLRSVMTVLGSILLAQPEVYLVYKEGLIDKNHHITDERTQKFLQTFLDNFNNWIIRLTQQK